MNIIESTISGKTFERKHDAGPKREIKRVTHKFDTTYNIAIRKYS